MPRPSLHVCANYPSSFPRFSCQLWWVLLLRSRCCAMSPTSTCSPRLCCVTRLGEHSLVEREVIGLADGRTHSSSLLGRHLAVIVPYMAIRGLDALSTADYSHRSSLQTVHSRGSRISPACAAIAIISLHSSHAPPLPGPQHYRQHDITQL
jgi:hypothetical protein